MAQGDHQTTLGTARRSDAELVAQVRGGCDRAFEQLYHRYHRRIAAFVLGRVNDHARAEDLAQEIFFAALRRIRATSQELVFKAWLYEIARNACIDQFRRAQRSAEVSLEDGMSADDHLRLVAPAARTNPDHVAEQRASLVHLRGAFGGLTDVHHRILVMRELEGLGCAEIAARLDMSVASVDSVLFRARRRLSEEYAELASGERCRSVQSQLGARLPGAREARRMDVHLSHCQPCRRHAALARSA